MINKDKFTPVVIEPSIWVKIATAEDVKNQYRFCAAGRLQIGDYIVKTNNGHLFMNKEQFGSYKIRL